MTESRLRFELIFKESVMEANMEQWGAFAMLLQAMGKCGMIVLVCWFG